jgi:aminopeptidase N
MRRSVWFPVAFLATATLLAAGVATAHADSPSPGAAGIGDRLYPTLGNGGYDALHYALDLRYATSSPAQGIDGTVTMTARATQSLSSFDLDFAGRGVGSVTVDGRSAAFTRVGEDIVITPKKAIRRGHRFVVAVRHFTADPTVVDPDDESTTAFAISPDGSATAGQPNYMHLVYPSNDHPRDKASFSFRFDVPAGQTAVANGDLTGKRVRNGRAIWTYEMRRPMATELTNLVVGKFTVVRRGSVGGVRIRDVVPTRLLAYYNARLPVEKSQVAWMQQRVGRYPFHQYGTLVNDAPIGFALENQTLSLYDPAWWGAPAGVWQPVMTHELAHQWFGDDVAPDSWSDIWQNEGHATWYELVYAAERGQLTDDTGLEGDFTDVMRQLYAQSDRWKAESGPVALPTDASQQFADNVYYGGAVVLYALRQKIGVAAFERVERAWVRQYAGRSASTGDFIRLASRVSGHDLTGFLGAWLYGTTTPPMPGHPDWKVTPVASASVLSKAFTLRR